MTGVRWWVVGAMVATAGLAAMDARAEPCTGSFYACPPPNRPASFNCLTSCDAGCPNTTGKDPIWYQMNCDTGEIGGGGGCSCAGAAQPIPRQTCSGTCTYRQCDPSASQPPCTVGQGACKNTGPKTCTLNAATQKTVLSCDVKPLPATVERCDGIDNDCDGEADDGLDVECCEQLPGGSTDCELDEIGMPTGKVTHPIINETNRCTKPCVEQHEAVHVKQLKTFCPKLRDCYLAADKGKRPHTECATMALYERKKMECEAYKVSVPCVEKRLKQAKGCQSKTNKDYGKRKLSSEKCFRKGFCE